MSVKKSNRPVREKLMDITFHAWLCCKTVDSIPPKTNGADEFIKFIDTLIELGEQKKFSTRDAALKRISENLHYYND